MTKFICSLRYEASNTFLCVQYNSNRILLSQEAPCPHLYSLPLLICNPLQCFIQHLHQFICGQQIFYFRDFKLIHDYDGKFCFSLQSMKYNNAVSSGTKASRAVKLINFRIVIPIIISQCTIQSTIFGHNSHTAT